MEQSSGRSGSRGDSEGIRRLTPECASRRLLVLEFVRQHIARFGESPSLSEIAHAHGISHDCARKVVQRLVWQGRLLKVKGMARGLFLPPASGAAQTTICPLSGGRVLDYLPPDGAQPENHNQNTGSR